MWTNYEKHMALALLFFAVTGDNVEGWADGLAIVAGLIEVGFVAYYGYKELVK